MARRDVLGDHPQTAVDRGRRSLDRAERADELDRHPPSRDREVLDRSLCVRAPQRRARHLDLAHRVVLDPGARRPWAHAKLGVDGRLVLSPRASEPWRADTVTAMCRTTPTRTCCPTGEDDTPYRLLTTDGVSTFDTPEGRFVKVEPEVLTLLTQEAMRDIAHLLRPGHLQQLRNILDDPESSAERPFRRPRPAQERRHRRRRRAADVPGHRDRHRQGQAGPVRVHRRRRRGGDRPGHL